MLVRAAAAAVTCLPADFGWHRMSAPSAVLAAAASTIALAAIGIEWHCLVPPLREGGSQHHEFGDLVPFADARQACLRPQRLGPSANVSARPADQAAGAWDLLVPHGAGLG